MTEDSHTDKGEREPRRAVRVGLTFEDFRSFITTYASNISMGGMFIRASNPLSPGTLCKMDVKLKDGFPLIRGLSEVAWTRDRAEGPDRPPGMGIRFRDLEQKSRDLIYEIVERRMADGGDGFSLEGEEEGGHQIPDLQELLQSAEKRRERETGEQNVVTEEELLPQIPDLPEVRDSGAREAESAASSLGASPASPGGIEAEPEDAAPEVFEALPDFDGEEDPFDALPPLEGEPLEARPIPTDSDPGEAALGAGAERSATAASDPRPAVNLDDLFPPLPRAEETPVPSRSSMPEWGAASSPDADEEPQVSPVRLAPALLVIAIGATLGVLWMSGTLPGWLGWQDEVGSIPTRPGQQQGAPATGDSSPAASPAASSSEGTSEGTEPTTVDTPAGDAQGAAASPPPPPTATAPPPRAASSAQDPFTRVRDIRTQSAGALTRVTVVCNGTIDLARVARERLGGASPRVVVRLRGVEQPYGQSSLAVGSDQLRQIRLGYHRKAEGNELHIVLDLAATGVRLADVETRDNLLILTLDGG